MDYKDNKIYWEPPLGEVMKLYVYDSTYQSSNLSVHLLYTLRVLFDRNFIRLRIYF